MSVTAEKLSNHAVRLRCLLRCTPERAYDAWTQPDQISKWFTANPTLICKVHEMDLSVGGNFKISMEGDGECYSAVGTYMTLDHPTRIAFTWQWVQSETEKGVSQVTIDLLPDDNGTNLILTHEKLSSLESTELHTEGWTSCLTNLEAYLASTH